MSSFADAIKTFVLENLRMNVWVALVHVVCAILIIGCIAIWVWRPTIDFIDSQKKKLEKEKTDLIVNNRETRYFLGLLKKEKCELFYTKRAIIKAAVEDAERIRVEARESVGKVVADMHKRAEERIGLMEDKAKEKVKEYIVSAAMELTEKLVDANMNDENNKAVIDAYIKELEQKKTMYSDTKSSMN